MTLRDARSVEQALAACLACLERGQPLAACLQDCPPGLRPEVLAALQAGERLRHQPRDPSPAFQARLEQRLRGALALRRQRASWWGLGGTWGGGAWLRPVALALAALALVAATGVGAVQAAADSLPDSPLYAVKTVQQDVAVAVAVTDEARLEVRLRQLPNQVRDVLRAVEAGKPDPLVRRLLTRVAATVRTTVDYAIAAQEAGDPEPSRRVRVALRALHARLGQLASGPVVATLQDLLAEEARRLGPPRGLGAPPRAAGGGPVSGPAPRVVQ